MKWVVELSVYDIKYRTRTYAKCQVLSNFLVERPKENPKVMTSNRILTLKVNGAYSKHWARIGICLLYPKGEVVE